MTDEPKPRVSERAIHLMPTGDDEPGFDGAHRMAAFLASVELHKAGVTIEDEDRFVPYLAQFIANWERRGGRIVSARLAACEQERDALAARCAELGDGTRVDVAATIAERDAARAQLASCREERDAAASKYDLLHRAVNDSADDCNEECDSYGHREGCKTNDPAKWIEDQQRALDAALASATAMREALERLVHRIKEIEADPAYVSVWAINQIHVGPYHGPTYIEAMDAARSALASPSGVAAAAVLKAAKEWVARVQGPMYEDDSRPSEQIVRDQRMATGELISAVRALSGASGEGAQG